MNLLSQTNISVDHSSCYGEKLFSQFSLQFHCQKYFAVNWLHFPKLILKGEKKYGSLLRRKLSLKHPLKHPLKLYFKYSLKHSLKYFFNHSLKLSLKHFLKHSFKLSMKLSLKLSLTFSLKLSL